jgi:hypothetical protein
MSTPFLGVDMSFGESAVLIITNVGNRWVNLRSSRQVNSRIVTVGKDKLQRMRDVITYSSNSKQERKIVENN